MYLRKKLNSASMDPHLKNRTVFLSRAFSRAVKNRFFASRLLQR